MDEMIEICVEVTGGNLLENAVVELNSGNRAIQLQVRKLLHIHVSLV